MGAGVAETGSYEVVLHVTCNGTIFARQCVVWKQVPSWQVYEHNRMARIGLLRISSTLRISYTWPHWLDTVCFSVMDQSERLGVVLALEQEFAGPGSRESCDLLLSAFLSALKASRRASGTFDARNRRAAIRVGCRYTASSISWIQYNHCALRAESKCDGLCPHGNFLQFVNHSPSTSPA